MGEKERIYGKDVLIAIAAFAAFLLIICWQTVSLVYKGDYDTGGAFVCFGAILGVMILVRQSGLKIFRISFAIFSVISMLILLYVYADSLGFMFEDLLGYESGNIFVMILVLPLILFGFYKFKVKSLIAEAEDLEELE